MKGLKTQIGGTHYLAMQMQPAELITALHCSWYQGCIIKYVSYYRSKNGLECAKS